VKAEIDFPAGPVADKLTLWPVDDGRYGLDAVFQGASGFERCEEHQTALSSAGIRCSLRQGMDDSWSLRLGSADGTRGGQGDQRLRSLGGVVGPSPTHDNGGYVNSGTCATFSISCMEKVGRI
jgi:hypothetical protein